MKIAIIYIGLLAAVLNIGIWQKSLNLAIGIFLLFQMYLVANDLPKE